MPANKFSYGEMDRELMGVEEMHMWNAKRYLLTVAALLALVVIGCTIGAFGGLR